MVAVSETQRQKVAKDKPKVARQEKIWIKCTRLLLYFISIIGVSVGASLIKTGRASSSYADGTYIAKVNNGEVIFYLSLIMLYANIMWGILRWFLRGYREKWTSGRVIGKLIGGGIWRFLVIVPLVLLSIMVITPKISDAIAKNVIDEQDKEEKISLSEPLDHLEYISEHLDEYDIEKLESELSPYLFNNIDFGVDASSNVSRKGPSGVFTDNVYAYSTDVKTLNKAVLSSENNFVVFYTDTGDDAISGEKAKELAEMLETIIKGYAENMGFEYDYQRLSNDLTKLFKMNVVLESCGIDTNILNTAMPVYIVNPYEEGSSTLASYAGRKFAEFGNDLLIKLGDLFGNETAKLYNSAPSYPFINILPSNIESDSLAIVTAHELGHHYVSNYSYDKYGSSESNDDFLDETTPNWMAINVLRGQPAENLINSDHYNENYLSGSTDMTIKDVTSGFLGYPAVAFLENYSSVVPGAKEIIMEATYNGDALQYLYDKAGQENFEKTMVSLAEKNLTGSYDGKLTNYTLPKGEELGCVDLCTEEYEINPAATEYLYFAVNEYKDREVKFEGSEGVRVSVLGKNAQGVWEIIKSGEIKYEYVFDDEVARKYEIVAFAVENSGIEETEEYTVEIAPVILADEIAESGEFDFGNIYGDLGQGCYELDTDLLFDSLGQLMGLGGEVLDALSELDNNSDWDSAKKEYAESVERTKGEIEEAKEKTRKYRITICANYIKEGRDFDSVEQKLRNAMGWNVNVYNEIDGDDRISIFVGGDLLARYARMFMLAKYDGEMGLISIDVAER